MTTILTHSAQEGKTGTCFVAQLFDTAGNSVASIDATADPAVATETARRLAACWNACDGISTDAMEKRTGLNYHRAYIIASVAAEELVRSEGELTGAPDTYAIAQCQADDHMRECIAFLVQHGEAASHETDDGYIMVMFIDSASGVAL